MFVVLVCAVFSFFRFIFNQHLLLPRRLPFCYIQTINVYVFIACSLSLYVVSVCVFVCVYVWACVLEKQKPFFSSLVYYFLLLFFFCFYFLANVSEAKAAAKSETEQLRN